MLSNKMSDIKRKQTIPLLDLDLFFIFAAMIIKNFSVTYQPARYELNLKHSFFDLPELIRVWSGLVYSIVVVKFTICNQIWYI